MEWCRHSPRARSGTKTSRSGGLVCYREEGTGRDGFGLNLGEGSEQRAAGQRVGWGSIGILGQTYMDRLAEESCST